MAKDGEVWNEGGRKATWTNRPNKDQPFFAIHNFTVSHESQIRKRPHHRYMIPQKLEYPPITRIIQKFVKTGHNTMIN